MKLLTAKKRKIAIIFSGGLGDTLLFLPFLKELKKKQFHITCIFYARDKNDCLFDKTLYDRKVNISSKAGLITFGVTNFKRFANFYINHLAKGKLIHMAGRMTSAQITRTDENKSGKNKSCRNIPVERDLSDAEQNLRLLFTAENARIHSIVNFYLPKPEIDRTLIGSHLDNKITDYYVVQVSAGNNNTPYKNWPIQNWLSITAKLCDTFKDTSFIIVGDEFEKGYSTAFEQLDRTNCKVLIGKTSITEVFNLVAFSNGYIGLDSGIMHMAVVLQKKTLTIFGASDEKLYGYSQLDKNHHLVITLPIYCRPCAAWKNANTIRVTDPMQCPDFACLTGIKEEEVYDKLVTHFNLS